MGYMFCVGACYGCKRTFSFNPDLVPSIPIDGVREPICQSCVNIANPERKKNGLAPIIVLEGAYDVAEAV